MKLNAIFENFLSAFQRVKDNQGGPGVDGVTIRQFDRHLEQNLACLQDELRQDTYSPLPLLKILIDKGKGTGEARVLSIPSVRDRVAQAAVLQCIEPILEKEFEDCSFAYRKGRSVKLAVRRIREYYDQGYRWVVDADIDAFFDTVDHDLLMAKIQKYINDNDLLNTILKWIKAEVWDGATITNINKGIPQGSPISPILANLFLDELDEAFIRKGYRIVRYADDFIILCKSPDKAREALDFSKEVLSRLLLELDEGEVVSFDEGFKYLGITFIRSMALVPFDRHKVKKKVLYYPPPLDIRDYLSKKKKNHEGT